MNWFFGCSIIGVTQKTVLFSTTEYYRAYYGFRIGPFLFAFNRWRKQ